MTESSIPKDSPVTVTPPAPQRTNTIVAYLLKVKDFALENWFLLGIGFAVGFAAALPEFGKKGGWIRSEYSIKYGAVIIIFLCSGMSLKTRVLLQALASLHIHVFTQAVSFGLTPLVGWGVASALRKSNMNELLIDGLVIATSMPTTVSTNVIFTKQAGGNEAVSLINAVIGNIIGIFVTPGLLLAFLGRSGQAPFSDVLFELGMTVLIPLAVGQFLQFVFPAPVKWLQSKINFGKVGNSMIILLVWSSFCNVFAQNIRIDAGSIVAIIFLDLALYLLFTAMCLSLAYIKPVVSLLGLTRADVIAITFVGATKTVALGLPLINVLYSSSPDTGILATPLLIYHAEQCLVGGTLLRPLRAWKERGEQVLPSSTSSPAS